MRLSEPRIEPSEAGEWNEEQRALMEKLERGVGPINVMRTLVRHEKLLRRWLPFTNHILFKSTISDRERELLILRLMHNLHITDEIKWSVRFEPLYDLQNSRWDYSWGFYLNYYPDFFLSKIKKNDH